MCGTHSFKPLCREYSIGVCFISFSFISVEKVSDLIDANFYVSSFYLQSGSYNFVREKPGQAVCPYDPLHNSTAVYVGKCNGWNLLITITDETICEPTFRCPDSLPATLKVKISKNPVSTFSVFKQSGNLKLSRLLGDILSPNKSNNQIFVSRERLLSCIVFLKEFSIQKNIFFCQKAVYASVTYTVYVFPSNAVSDDLHDLI